MTLRPFVLWKEYRTGKSTEKSDQTYLKKKLNLMSLEKRRSLADVTFLYKVLNGNIY